jgi:hypothetical protein
MSRSLLSRRVTGAIVGLFALVLAMSGCGNLITVHDAGQLGITVDDAGRPVIAVMSCAPATPVIDLSQGRTESDPDSRPNVHRGTWRATARFSGVERIALTAASDSGPTWTAAGRPGTLEPGRLFVVTGGTAEDKDASLVGVSFRVDDLSRLSPDQIQVDGHVESLASFGAYRCR